MPNQQTVTFQEALDVVESLPTYQQEDLINLLSHRLTDQKRELLAKSIKEAREEYARGEIRKGTVDDLMGESPNENSHLE